MLSKIFVFITLAAVAAANCGNVVPSCGTNNVVSNNCRCVKTIVRPVPVRSVVCRPTERREVQTFIRPVVQNVAYTVNTPVCSGPNVGGYGYNSGSNIFAGNNFDGLVGNNYGSSLIAGNTYGSSLIAGNTCGATAGFGGLAGNAYGSSLISGNTCGASIGCGGLAGNTYGSSLISGNAYGGLVGNTYGCNTAC